MAANDQIAGRITFWAGPVFGPLARQITPAVSVTDIDNAVGSNAVTFAPAGKISEAIPQNSQIIVLPPGPHASEGDNVYVCIEPDVNAKAFDSTGSTDGKVSFGYYLRDRKTGRIEKKSIVSDASRNTTVLDGGLADDMTVYTGRPNAIYAFKLCPPGCDLILSGHARVDPRTTA